MKLKLFLVLCLCTTISITAQEISDNTYGKGLLNFIAKDSSFSVKFAPRFQMRYTSAWDHDGEEYGDANQNFIIRRARLKFDGFAYSPKLKYKLELGLSNRDLSGGSEYTRDAPRMILDAVLMWHFAKNWELWAGQTKLPGNVERVISSANLQLIDRSLLNSRFTLDRDVGLQLRHKFYLGENFLIREKLALSQGEGRNVTEGNEGGMQYTARLELLPFGAFKSKGDYSGSDIKREPTPKLSLTFTYNQNKDAVRERGVAGSYMVQSDGESLYQTDIETLFLDSMFKYDGFSFMGEYAKRTADNPVADNPPLNSDGELENVVVLTGNALNLQAGYLFKSNYEVAGRYTSVDYKTVTGADPVKQYTLGVNKFVHAHKLKVQSDITYATLDGNEDNITFRLGFDFHF